MPETTPRTSSPVKSKLDPFVPYVLKRWNEGEFNGTQLYREFRDQCYTGSRPLVGELFTLSSHPNDFQHPTRYERGKTMIQTPNLQLLPIERVHIEVLLRSKSELAALLQVTVPDGWPHFPEAFSLAANESHAYNLLVADWGGYFFLHRKDRVLVGHGAFKGPPDDAGTVEIGYEIASEYWNRGRATEAAQGMIEYAFSHQEVRAVIAHTLAQRNASNRVLQKVGMQFMAEVEDPEEGKVWRWQISRDEYHPA